LLEGVSEGKELNFSVDYCVYLSAVKADKKAQKEKQDKEDQLRQVGHVITSYFTINTAINGFR